MQALLQFSAILHWHPGTLSSHISLPGFHYFVTSICRFVFPPLFSSHILLLIFPWGFPLLLSRLPVHCPLHSIHLIFILVPSYSSIVTRIVPSIPPPPFPIFDSFSFSLLHLIISQPLRVTIVQLFSEMGNSNSASTSSANGNKIRQKSDNVEIKRRQSTVERDQVRRGY